MAELVAQRALQHSGVDVEAVATSPLVVGTFYKNNGETRLVVIVGATGVTMTVKGVLDNNRRIEDTVIVMPANSIWYITPMAALLYSQVVQLEFTNVTTVQLAAVIEE